MSFPKRETLKKPSSIHAYVATPAYDGKVFADYALSLAQSFQFAALYGINCTAAVMGNGAFIDLARNNFALKFLETDCTHLFFIDADLKWEPRGFLGLLTSGLPVSAGAYRRRQEPETYPVRHMLDANGGLQVNSGFLLCDRVATGFLCIERKVIEEMARDAIKYSVPESPETPRLFYTQITKDNQFMGEDYAWCDDYVARYKRPIHLFMDLDFSHAGYKCNYARYLEAEIKKQSEALSE